MVQFGCIGTFFLLTEYHQETKRVPASSVVNSCIIDFGWPANLEERRNYPSELRKAKQYIHKSV